MFASLVAFCLGLLISKSGSVLDRALLLFAAMVAVVWVQWGAGLIAYRGDATVSSLYLLGFALAWWLGTNSARDPEQAARTQAWLATLFITAALLSLAIAVLQWLSMEGTLGTLATERMAAAARPYSNLGQPNHLATFLLMAIVLSCALYVQRRIQRWQWIALVLAFSFGLVMAESRAGWASVLVLSLLFLWRGDSRWGLGGWKALASWWAMLLLMVTAWRPLNELLLLAPTRSGSWVQDGPRLAIWRQMWAGIEQSPWLGYGWRQTIAGQKAGAIFVDGMYPTDYAHSVVLDLLLWLGIPLGLLLMAVAAWWLVLAARRIQGSTQFLLLAATLPVLVHSLVEFPFVYAYFLLPVGWLLGALSGLQGTPGRTSWRLQGAAARFGLFGVVLVFTLLSAWIAMEYLAAEEDHRVMRFELRRLGQTPLGYEPPSLLLLDQLDELLKLARLEPYPGMPASDIARMGAANRSFEWATLQLRYAVALGLNGQPEAASLQLVNLRAMYGKASYAQALQQFEALRRGKYPQLETVKLP